MKTRTLEQWKEQEHEANRAIARLRDEERRAENAALVGKTFKYRNNYSCPKKPSDYWYLYVKVTGMNRDGSLKLFTFETDKYRHIVIGVDRHMYGLDESYKPISAAEYRKALAALKARVAKF